MEGDDLFIRTLEEDGAEIPSSDDEGNDSGLDLGGKPFFEAERPAGWDLSEARAAAQKTLPFQTSIDTKIRATLAKLPSSDGPTEPAEEPTDDDDNADADNAGEKTTKRSKKQKRKDGTDGVTFETLNLSRALIKAVNAQEWNKPTPVQARAIPYILSGRDVCGSAVTGSGKTGAFVLPILERLIQAGVDNVTRVVILLPTRELAAQCHSVVTTLAKYTSIRAALAVGGLSNVAQENALRTRPHVLVATPGRLIDHMRNAHSFSLDDVEILVMDEADRLLDMGFKDEVEEIVRHTPASRQTLLFSATMTPKLGELIKLSLRKPARLTVDPMFDVAATLSQEFVKLKTIHEKNKDAMLLALAKRTFTTRVIVFFRQKVTAHRFRILFGLARLRVAELHGNLTQAQRLGALDQFRRGDVDFLLCTDLAARGLDIAGVDTVINYDMPFELKEYVHRVGRTARAGASGRCCSLVCSDRADERKVLNLVAKKAKSKLAARVVPPAVVGKWRAWIDSMEEAVKQVLKEERQEKALRMGEMELRKAQNILKHESEIYGRPKRTWFQTGEERMEAVEKGRLDKGLGHSERVKRKLEKKRKAEEKKADAEKTEREREWNRQKAEARKAKRKKMEKSKR